LELPLLLDPVSPGLLAAPHLDGVEDARSETGTVSGGGRLLAYADHMQHSMSAPVLAVVFEPHGRVIEGSPTRGGEAAIVIGLGFSRGLGRAVPRAWTTARSPA
jgi:hypothetical protein